MEQGAELNLGAQMKQLKKQQFHKKTRLKAGDCKHGKPLLHQD
jgi:hypothetical protein